MLSKAKVNPIKVQVIPIGAVVAGAAVDTADTVLRFTSPSRRIHFTLQVGWTIPDAATPVITGTINLYPMMKDPNHGSNFIRMQPVLSGGNLPDGYEGESGVKDWEADLHFESLDTDPGRIFAVITWEPSLVEMCEEEHAYWAGLCNAQLVGPQISIGGSL